MALKAVAADKVAQLLDSLAENPKPTEIDKKRVEQNIEQLKYSSAAAHYMYKGVYNSILGNEAESKDNHLKSLRLESGLPFYLNYAISVRRLGYFKDALLILLDAPRQLLTSARYVSQIVQTMYLVGDFSSFNDVRDAFVRANPDQDFTSLDSVAETVEIMQYLDNLSIPHDEYRVATGCLNDTIFREGFRGKATMVTLSSFDGVPVLSVRIALPIRDASMLTRINDLLVEAMITNDYLAHWDQMVFTVVSTDNHHQFLQVVA